MPRPESVSFRCPHCRKKSRVPASYAGKAGKCPGCLEPIQVPSLDGERDPTSRGQVRTFLATGSGDEPSFELLVVGDDSLRRLAGEGALDASAPTGSLIEEAAAASYADASIPLERLESVALDASRTLYVSVAGAESPQLLSLKEQTPKAFAYLEKHLTGFERREVEIPPEGDLKEMAAQAMVILIAGGALAWLAWVLGGESVSTGTLKRGGLVKAIANGLGVKGVAGLTTALLAVVGVRAALRVNTPKTRTALVRRG